MALLGIEKRTGEGAPYGTERGAGVKGRGSGGGEDRSGWFTQAKVAPAIVLLRRKPDPR